MEDPCLQDQHSKELWKKHEELPSVDELPPTPPFTEDNSSDKSVTYDETEIPLPPPSEIPTAVLDIDKKTPDSHVPRDPRLIRLTGVHPFNVEAPLSALFNEGFLTSPELFYVRNHGAVPEVHDEDIPNWAFTVEGLGSSLEAPSVNYAHLTEIQTRREPNDHHSSRTDG